MSTQKNKQGLVHLYVGDGKGKTTAAVGLAVRAAGYGMKVLWLQFLKDGTSAEVAVLQRIGITTMANEKLAHFFSAMDEQEKKDCIEESQKAFAAARQALLDGSYDLVVLDEAVDACNLSLIAEQELIDAAKCRAAGVELVITGHNPTEALIKLADYVSEIRAVKHPYRDKKISARPGIEY